MLRRGQVHGIAGRLARLENRVSARRSIPLAVRRPGGILETADGRIFPSLAAIMAETGQDKAPLVIEPDMPEEARK